jgi:hypothetical protein
MYDASIPVLVKILASLSKILDKAASFAELKKIDPTVLVNARLAPDMFPLCRQIQIASDTAKGCAARLSGMDVPVFPDDETTLAALQARIEKTITFMQSVKPADINHTEDRDITLKMGSRHLELKGQAYLLYFVLPNFYFHVTTAYAILRHNGVEIGKTDFLGASA